MTTHAFRLLVVTLALGAATLAHGQALPHASSPEAVGLSSERLGRLTAVMRDAARDRQVAGTVTLIARDGRVAYLEAAGALDLERGTPMRTDSIFRIASMTKAVTSVGIMMLVEEGRLSISDPVSKFIPAFAKTTVLATDNGRVAVVPARRPITIRDLLTHTAGISYGAGALEPYYKAAGFTEWYFADRSDSMSTWIDKLATLPFESQPGDRWVYGYNTDILGNVIERITGQTLAAFLDARIIAPLKMVDTSFFLPADKESRLAAVYAVAPDGTLTRGADGHPGQGSYIRGPRAVHAGGAGLLSTAADYARFLQMLANGGELDGVRLLSPTTVALMTSNHVGTLYRNGELGWGLGFEVVERVGRAPRYGAAGEFSWSGAYHTTYWVDPAEKLVVVFMTQLLPAGPVDLRMRVRTLVNQAIVGPPQPVATPTSTSAQRVPRAAAAADHDAPARLAVLTAALPGPVVATFALLVVAMAALWAPRLSAAPHASHWWVVPLAGAVLMAQGSGLVDTRGLGLLLVFVTACRLVQHAPDGALRGFAIAVTLALAAGFLAHALPGFANPRVLDGVRLSADSVPYTEYLNIDKGLMGLVLLGLVAPTRTARRSRLALPDAAWRVAVVTAVVMTATLAAGYVRWDPKLPAWWPLWSWTMVFLTALPEEALFRHVVQGGLQDWLGGTLRARWIGIGVAGVLFGLAHIGGGWTYVMLATLAGLGYGWAYAASDSIAMAILTHSAVNLLHLLFFSYPALSHVG